MQVKVANGQVLSCTHELQNCEVIIQRQCFSMDLKILPLQYYDMILGMNWLEIYNPMKVHWSEKWMSFLYQDKKIKLQGLRSSLHEINIISYQQLQKLEDEGEVWCTLKVFATKPEEGTH